MHGRPGLPANGVEKSKYSDTAIQTALTLRTVFNLPLRQTEGFLRSLLELMAVGLEAPDHTTLSRRSRHLTVRLRRPATRKAVVSGRRQCATARDRTIRKVKRLGRREWKRVSGYHRQGTVENAFFRYKSIIGDRLRARSPEAQRAEAVVACNALNKMFDLGRPVSKAIAS